MTELLLLSLMVFAAWTAFEMLRPYLDAILIAGLFAVIMNPIYQRLLSLWPGSRSLIALLTSLLLTAVVVIPCFLVIWRLSQEAATFSQAVGQWVSSDSFQEFMKKPVIMRVMNGINRYFAEVKELTVSQTGQDTQINQMVIDAATSVAKRLVDQGSYIAGHAVSLLGTFLLMIFAFFFMIRDQDQLRRSIFRLLPFTRHHEDEICQKIVSLSRSTILGAFLTAVAQGLGAAAGFWLTGLPVLSGAVAAAFTSLIPVIGTSVVWLPATLYLLFVGNVGSAIFLSIWWLVVVAFFLDYLLRPLLMSGRAEMSMPLIFFFILGGIHLFGLFGVLYGPLILGMLYLLVYLYELTMIESGPRLIKGEGRGIIED